MNDNTVSNPDDRLARIHERAERDYPESWIPENPGDEIAGELVRYERGTTAYGEQNHRGAQDGGGRTLGLAPPRRAARRVREASAESPASCS